MILSLSGDDAYGKLEHMRVGTNKNTGFTIVELLIVVVVIAILAAITIVAFNGVTNRAKASAIQSTAGQAAKKLGVYATTNGGVYPINKAAFLTATGLADSTDIVYEYIPSNDFKNYCVSVTRTDDSSGQFEYGSTSVSGSVVQGRCGINYARNPSPVAGAGPWTGFNIDGSTTASFTPNALDGRDAYRWTAGAPGFSANMTIGLEYTGLAIAVPGNVQIAPSIMVRSSKAGTFRLHMTYRHSSTESSGDQYGNSRAVPANSWVELSTTTGLIDTPVTADRMSIRAQYVSGATWVPGDWIEVTKVSTAAGNRTYGDAQTNGWFWMGAENSSPSVGIAAIE